MLPSIRKVVLAGLSVAVAASAAACSGQPKEEPVWAGSVQGLETPAATPAATGETPEATAPSPSAKPRVTPSKPAATAVKVGYTFPVTGGKSSYAHTHHDYPATDLMTACGNSFVAVTSGVVLTTRKKDTWSPKVNAGETRGGLSVAILGDDGVRYYGSHLKAVAAGIDPGARVKKGQKLGTTGDTGDASACHLHFGISPPCYKTTDWWNQRGTLYPWPYLDSWRKGGQKSPVAAVKAWQQKNGCPKKPTVDK
ncbi:M23 family metallopeptidase [Actinoplanes sp. CA-030573]|uniref:M23 family metallopeptidase n=1 Tax=Actinoplanes sp. CA-030573 TaxID=3239898 RepID=UPI003D8A6925